MEIVFDVNQRRLVGKCRIPYHPDRCGLRSRMHKVVVVVLAVLGCVALQLQPVHAQRLLGFDLSNAVVPRNKIFNGGPGRDGIPAILDPVFVPARSVRFLNDTDQVVGFAQNGQARAYPLRILVWHEIVNDTVGGRPVAVTYCPLCGTVMVFDRQAGGTVRSFGVSGLLYENNMLLYDHQTETLWSQLMMQAVSGRLAGTSLQWLPSEQMTWKAWKRMYPAGEVLSTETGFNRDYGRTPYGNFESSDTIYFPVTWQRHELSAKTWVAGIIVNGTAKAYQLEAFGSSRKKTVRDVVGGEEIDVSYDPRAKRAQATVVGTGAAVPTVTLFWYAWQAFYPQTELYVKSR